MTCFVLKKFLFDDSIHTNAHTYTVCVWKIMKCVLAVFSYFTDIVRYMYKWCIFPYMYSFMWLYPCKPCRNMCFAYCHEVSENSLPLMT